MSSLAEATNLIEVSLDGNPVALGGDCAPFLISYLPNLVTLTNMHVTEQVNAIRCPIEVRYVSKIMFITFILKFLRFVKQPWLGAQIKKQHMRLIALWGDQPSKLRGGIK